MNNKVALILLSSGLLVACGGGGGGSSSNTPAPNQSSAPASSLGNSPISSVLSSAVLTSSLPSSSSSSMRNILQGQFKDTNVSGLQFVSGSQSGITNATGTFNYEQDEAVVFSVGEVNLGQIRGASVITPLDLAIDADTNSPAIINRVKFLLMLDSDGYVDNGIQISPAVQSAAKKWAAVDFTSANFTQDIAPIMSSASAADGGTHQLPDTSTAKRHIETTHWCTRSGIFTGSNFADKNIRFAFFASATNGQLDGFMLSGSNSLVADLQGVQPISMNASASFLLRNNATQVEYGGVYPHPDELVGTLQQNAQPEAAFTAQRLGGKNIAIYRYSAIYNGSERGLLSFDIDSVNNISGVIYYLASNTSKSLSGSLKGPWLTATTADNVQLQGMVNWTTNELSGSWANSAAGTSGTFTGSGCQLNPAPLTINGFDDWKIGFNPGSQPIIPASGTSPLAIKDGAAVAHVRLKVAPWGEMSFPLAGVEQSGEAESIDLSSSRFIEITYQANQSVNLQLRQYAIHGGTHNQITLPAAAEFTTVKIPFSDFKGGLTPLDLTRVAKFNFALLSNNVTDGYADLVVKEFKIDKFN